MRVLLVYDIPHDRTRTKVADICLDYGLERIQYSAFMGTLQRVYQEEMITKIRKRLGKRPGKIQLFPLCDKDWQVRLEICQEEPNGADTEGK